MAGPLIGAVVGGFAGYLSAGTAFALAGVGASVFANVLAGAQLGFSLGGMLTAPGAPDVKGPRLEDLSVQTSTYGANIPRLYGTVVVTGNVIWLEKDKIREKKKKSGGKGGGGSVTTYKYFATFAVGLCKGQVVGIKRMWIGSNLVYDGGGTGVSGIIQSKKQKAYWTLYPGTDDQLPSPLIQADKGVDSVSAYPGEAYITFENLPLAKYGNSLAGAQVKVEVVMAGTLAWQSLGSVTGTQVYAVGTSHHFDGRAGYYFEPLSSNPTIFRVNYMSSALQRKVLGVVDTGVSGIDAHCVNGVLDIPATAIHLGNGDGPVVMVDRNGVVKTFSLPATVDGYGAGQMVVTKSGDAVFVATRNSGTDCHLVRFSYKSEEQTALSAAPFFAEDMQARDGVLYALQIGTAGIKRFDADTLEVLSDIATPGGWVTDHQARISVVDADNIAIVNHGNSVKIYDGAAWSDAVTPTYGIADGGSALFYERGVLVVADEETLRFYALLIAGTSVSLAGVVEAECLQSSLLEAADLDVTDLSADLVRGYRLADTAPIRGGLEPLQAIWPFDIRMHGYSLQFVRRGNASVATVPAADLDARPAGADPGPLLIQPREMDSQLPQKSLLRYLEIDREYDTGEQSAQRYNTDAVNVAELEVAVVLSATEAARAVEVLHYAWWRERGADIQFRLPPTYLHLEPADVVTVTDSAGGIHVLRLTAIHYTAAGVLECTARREAQAAYSSTAVGDTGDSTGSGIVVNGPTLATLMDLPALTADGDIPGFYAALCGIEEDWPGGTLFGSQDAGQTWTDLESTDSAAVMGGVEAALGAATCFDRIDAAGTLTVLPYAGELASVTETEMLAGANHFAYGADGRWEILAAKTITLNGDGSYTLQDFLRGRMGTEQYASTHQAGDRLVLLGSADTLFIDLPTAAIGQPGVYRPVSFGESLDDETDEAFTYNAENLKPRSPIFLNGSRHITTKDWTLTWVRRARINTEWRDLVDVALDEASESYEIEIYDGAGYATVKRTLTASSPTVEYTSAAQVADFGANQNTLYLKIYQISATVGRGHPLVESITRTSLTRVLGLHYEGANGSTTFTEVTGKTVTANGNAQLTTTSPIIGSASGNFDGSGDYLSIPDSPDFDIGTGDFHICTFARFTSHTSIHALVSNYVGASSGLSFQRRSDTNVLSFAWGDTILLSASWTPTDGVPYWLEVLRQSGVLKLKVDCVEIGSVANTTNLSGSTASLKIGSLNGSVQFFHGQLEETQFYTGDTLNFTSPPTSPFA